MTNIPYKLPDGWQWVKLGEVCEIIMGQSPPSKSYNTTGRGLPFFQGKADFGELYPNPRVWCDAPKKIARMDDILISVRAPVGAVNIAKETCCIGRGLAALRLKAEGELFWLFFYLRFIEKYLAEKGSGSTFKAITKKDLETLLIPLPPLDEQKRIVARLEELMSKIKEVKRLRKETKKQTELLWQSILAETFPQPGAQLPNGWRWVRLGNVARIFSGSPAPQDKRYFEGGSMPFVRVQDLGRYGITTNLTETSDKINGEAVKELRLVKANKGTILFPKSGAAILTNSRAILGEDAYIVSHLAAVEPFYGVLETLWAFYWLCTVDMGRYIDNPAYPSLRLSKIRELLIPLPPLEEQKRIANYLQEVHEKIKELKEVQAKTEEEIKLLEQSILEKAFRGEL